MILVTMRYTVRDISKFEDAMRWFRSLPVEDQSAPEGPPPRMFRAVNDPSQFIFIEEWDSMVEIRTAWGRWQTTRRSEWLDRAGIGVNDIERIEWEATSL